MPRWKNARDANDLEIFRALQAAGRNPIRGRDCDIYAEHTQGHGVMLEVKTKNGRLRKIQSQLAGCFKDRYYVVRNVSEALQAVGFSGGQS